MTTIVTIIHPYLVSHGFKIARLRRGHLMETQACAQMRCCCAVYTNAEASTDSASDYDSFMNMYHYPSLLKKAPSHLPTLLPKMISYFSNHSTAMTQNVQLRWQQRWKKWQAARKNHPSSPKTARKMACFHHHTVPLSSFSSSS